jgi:hypothetical protein
MPASKSSNPSLSDAAYGARLFIKYGAIAVVVLMVGRVLLNGAVSLYKALNPPKAPPPTYGFGSLPALQFPTTTATVNTFVLQTKNGALPKLDNQLPVFFMPKQTIGPLSLDNAKQIAAAFGFVFQPEQTSTTMYRWKRATPFPATLDIDIITQHFKMKVDWASDPGFLTQKDLPQQLPAITNTRALLQEANLLPADMATSEGRVSYLKASGLSFAPAVSLSEADFLQIDINRQPIREKYAVVGPDPLKGNVHVIFSGNKNVGTSGLVQADYSYAPILYDRFETYGLITPTVAFQQLQEGKGYVAHIDQGVQQATIRNVYLGYYDAETPQSYLQPIYIFVGDQNFYGYVPAVAPLSQSSNK